MADTSYSERRQQQFEELCATTIRALTGQTGLRYRGRRLHNGNQPVALHVPHLRTDSSRDDFQAFRGAADGIALRLCNSDAALHQRLQPADPVPRLVFELLEQLRVESLVPEQLPGVSHNVRKRFTAWCKAYHAARMTETHRGILVYTLLQIVWARLNGVEVLEDSEGVIEATRFNLIPLLGNALAGLRRERHDQAAYATHALEIAGIIGQLLESDTDGDEQDAGSEELDEAEQAFALLLDFDSDLELDVFSAALSGESKAFATADAGYKVFSNEYDREVAAASLVRADYLRGLRQTLDERIRRQKINITRLARGLSALLATPSRDGWNFGQDEGYIDARRLGQLVASPAERRVFYRQRLKPHADCLFTILIDCSGSMKQHIEQLAVLVDVLTRALELAEVKTEVLGFTTGAWNGGRCQRDWFKSGRPKNPGRLNELLHLVYKSADTPWRRARPDMAAILKADLFREGIDGEAVEWASRRLLARDEERRILLVISDGCPMDTATNLANDRFYLDNHLKQVIAGLESERVIDIYALGVGLDLSPFYSRSLALDLSHGVGQQIFDDILQLLKKRN